MKTRATLTLVGVILGFFLAGLSELLQEEGLLAER